MLFKYKYCTDTLMSDGTSKICTVATFVIGNYFMDSYVYDLSIYQISQTWFKLFISHHQTNS
jgi:hypothetical protein